MPSIGGVAFFGVVREIFASYPVSVMWCVFFWGERDFCGVPRSGVMGAVSVEL